MSRRDGQRSRRPSRTGAAAGLSEKEFSDAYLLNLDITNGDRSYTFAITDIDVGDTSVTVAVTLTRSGSIAQAVTNVVSEKTGLPILASLFDVSNGRGPGKRMRF